MSFESELKPTVLNFKQISNFKEIVQSVPPTWHFM